MTYANPQNSSVQNPAHSTPKRPQSLAELLGDVRWSTDAEVTIFKSVGIAAQDVAAANVALSNAVDLGLGIDLS